MTHLPTERVAPEGLSFSPNRRRPEPIIRIEEPDRHSPRLGDYTSKSKALAAPPQASADAPLKTLAARADRMLEMVARGEACSRVLGALGGGLEAIGWDVPSAWSSRCPLCVAPSTGPEFLSSECSIDANLLMRLLHSEF